jgi:rare lipoprotein A
MRKFGLLLVCLTIALAGCSSKKSVAISDNDYDPKLDPFAGKGSPYYQGGKNLPFGGGKYHVGKPYQVAGKWFTPKEQPNYDKVGMASWYGEAFHARKTSNGEWFDMNDMTAAHPTLPLPSYAKVTNTANGNTIIVRINDRGPFVGTRIIDLSKKSASLLDFKRKGKAEVRVQWLGVAPINDDGSHLAMMNRQLYKGASVKQLVASIDNEVPITPTRKKKKRAEPEAVQTAENDVVEEPAPIKKSGGYLIQVASFSEQDNASAAVESMSIHGPASIAEAVGENGTTYKVQVGPFPDKREATTALYAVRDTGFPDAKLMRIIIQQVSSR